jgi:hypothetical protein
MAGRSAAFTVPAAVPLLANATARTGMVCTPRRPSRRGDGYPNSSVTPETFSHAWMSRTLAKALLLGRHKNNETNNALFPRFRSVKQAAQIFSY